MVILDETAELVVLVPLCRVADVPFQLLIELIDATSDEAWRCTCREQAADGAADALTITDSHVVERLPLLVQTSA